MFVLLHYISHNSEAVTRYYHLALMYCTPWRPTFLELERDPSGDRECGAVLGVAPKRDATHPWVALTTLWELAEHWEPKRFMVTGVKLYRLIADNRSLDRLRPHKLVIKVVHGTKYGLKLYGPSRCYMLT